MKRKLGIEMTLTAQEKEPIQKKAPKKKPRVAASKRLLWRSPNKKGDSPSHASIPRSKRGNETDTKRDEASVRKKRSPFLTI
jgi:hypothetical protein